MSLPALSVELDLQDQTTPTAGTITFSNLGSTANPDVSGTTVSSLVNTSWTPPTSGLVILYVASRVAAGPNVPTVSGNSLTWVQIATVLAAPQRITLFGANASGSTTGATTVSFGGQTQDGALAYFMAATGVDLSSGVLAAFVQTPTANATGTSASLTLAAAANASNRPIVGWISNYTLSYTPRTNWTEADDTAADLNGMSGETQYRSDAFETTASVTWDGANRSYLGIAAELKVVITNVPTTPTWSADITPYVRAWSSRRGASRELQRVEAGTGSITLDNLSGRFTPQSTTSVYYPNLLPMRRVRIRATWNGTTYPIFQGFVESWPASFPEIGKDQIVTISLVDGFKVLSLAAVSGSFSSQLSGARVNAILDAISWPAADRSIATGVSTVPAVTLTNESALTHLQAIEHAEGGRLFMSRDGKVTFIQRGTASTPAFGGRTWTDDGTGMSYRDLRLDFGDELIINDARLTRAGGTEQVATDATSTARYWKRSFTESGIQLGTDNEVSDLAHELVGKYKNPAIRIEGLADNAMRHGQWANLLVRDLRDRVLIVKTPTGASTLSQDSYIEGIEHSWVPDEWRSSLTVSPAVADLLFIWDTSRWDIDAIWAR